MMYLYAARNFSTLVGLASPDPLTNMYDAAYFRATWVLTALDAGFWTAMRISNKTLRDLASIVFSLFYMVAAEQADEKVRKVRGNITVEHLRVSWNKGNQSPYLRFLQGLVRPRFTRWPPRAIRIPRPSTSDYKDPVVAWLYFDGPLSELQHHNHIILDIPGGGFVAMDPRCNDDKLFAWAAKTGLPVLSLDYKKAPEYPYPYALNECYDVYTTIIKSRGRCVGLSGKEIPRVVITGDSAGGTLAAATMLMIIESGSSPVRRFQGQTELPVPDGLILFYPSLDMNIGSWMSDEQMALINDRRMRGTNKRIMERKTMQYNDLIGTPHPSDDEDDEDDDSGPSTKSQASLQGEQRSGGAAPAPADAGRSPAPEYAHSFGTTWSNVQQGPPPSSPSREKGKAKATSTSTSTSTSTGTGTSSSSSSAQSSTKQPQGASHHPEPMRTRLAMSSMISYFNDRVLTPEMMRAMIILYVGPHNRPDFSQDYLLSPILAPDALLARFPKTYFLTGERDPLVDDTVIFAGRLRRVKAKTNPGIDDKDVAEVVLLPGVSHGFLQFPTIYPPAWKLIDRTAGWVEDLFSEAERKDRETRERRGRERVRRGEPSAGGAGVGLSLVQQPPPPQTEEQHHHQQQQAGHHYEQESSGEEDNKPLEMSMAQLKRRSTREGPSGGGDGAGGDTSSRRTQGRGRSGLEEGTNPPEKEKSGAATSETRAYASANGETHPRDDAGGNGERRKRKGARRSRPKDDDRSLVKLASSDDLLGRRMKGLASKLTGLHGDVE